MTRTSCSALVALLAAAASAPGRNTWVAGKHYTVIPSPAHQRARGQGRGHGGVLVRLPGLQLTSGPP